MTIYSYSCMKIRIENKTTLYLECGGEKGLHKNAHNIYVYFSVFSSFRTTSKHQIVLNEKINLNAEFCINICMPCVCVSRGSKVIV